MANYDVSAYDTGEQDTVALTLAAVCNRLNFMTSTTTIRDIEVDFIRDRERCQGHILHDYDPNTQIQQGVHGHFVDSIVLT
jgi:hypothetical protein